MQVPAVQQVKTAVGENYRLAFRFCLGADYLKLVDRFELPRHIQLRSMRFAGFQLKVRVIVRKSVA